jgi:DNA polymerase III alpha subunit
MSLYQAYYKAKYPLEYYSVTLDMYKDNLDKTNDLVSELSYFNIELNPIRFGKSKGAYAPDKDNNAIYKGLSSIKYLNTQVGDELFELSKNNYTSFISLLKDIEDTSIDSRQMTILIKLDYFRDFGKAKSLLELFELYNQWSTKSQFHKENNQDDILQFIKLGISLKDIKENSDETNKLYRNINFINLISIIENNIADVDFKVAEKIEFQNEYLGYVNFTSSDYDNNVAICLGIDTKYSPKIDLMSLGNGNKFQVKVKKKQYKINPLNEYDIIEIIDVKKEYGWMKVDDEWKRNTDRIDWWMNSYKVIERND